MGCTPLKSSAGLPSSVSTWHATGRAGDRQGRRQAGRARGFRVTRPDQQHTRERQQTPRPKGGQRVPSAVVSPRCYYDSYDTAKGGQHSVLWLVRGATMIVMIQPTLQRPPELLPGRACGRSRRENCTLLPSSYCMSCPYASPAKDPAQRRAARAESSVLSRFRLTCHCWLHTHVRRRVRHGQAELHTHARAGHGHTLRGHTCVRVVQCRMRAMQATTGIRMCNRFQCGAQALRSVVQHYNE